MYSCGIDLVEINRIKKSLENPRFLMRYFSKEEIEMFQKRNYFVSSVAANFAAKEAFSKALGTGIRGFSLDEISVLRDESGAPFFVFSGNAKKIVDSRRLNFSLSLSHTDTTACAMVVGFVL